MAYQTGADAYKNALKFKLITLDQYKERMFQLGLRHNIY